MDIFKRFLKDESGLSAVEYGLLAAGIAGGSLHAHQRHRDVSEGHLHVGRHGPVRRDSVMA